MFKSHSEDILRFGSLFMASWVLTCPKCLSEFPHSVIPQALADLFLPAKPELLPDTEFECPTCGHKAAYKRSDLLYRQ
jgi:DNA-directed RNA polymerase subunit RPC12/RpoP